MPSILISGANRGLGLEFAKQYAAAGWQVHGTARDPDLATALKAIKGDVRVHALNVADKRSTDQLALALQGVPLDIVIANAGVAGPRGMSIEAVDRDSWLETLAVNTVAPVALASALKRNLDKGKQKKLIAISSGLGSIANNTSGGLYVYRSAKAALNAVWHSLAVDLAGAGYICVVIAPGWVRTDMGGAEAPLDAETSIAGMRRVIDGLTPAQNGSFLNYEGGELPW